MLAFGWFRALCQQNAVHLNHLPKVGRHKNSSVEMRPDRHSGLLRRRLVAGTTRGNISPLSSPNFWMPVPRDLPYVESRTLHHASALQMPSGPFRSISRHGATAPHTPNTPLSATDSRPAWSRT